MYTDGNDGAQWMSLPVNRHFPWLSEGFWTFPQRWGVGTACQKSFLILCHVHEVPHLLSTSSETINSMNSLNRRNPWNPEAKKGAHHCLSLPLTPVAGNVHLCRHLDRKEGTSWYEIHETWRKRRKYVDIKSMKPGSSGMVGCFSLVPPKAPSSRQRTAVVKGPSKIQRAWKENIS